jgi:hypothetical protein
VYFFIDKSLLPFVCNKEKCEINRKQPIQNKKQKKLGLGRAYNVQKLKCISPLI